MKTVSTLVLACLHYSLLEKSIKKFMGKDIKIVNPAEAVAKEIKIFLENNPRISVKKSHFAKASQDKGGNHQFFFSDEPYNFKKISHLCFNKKIKIKVNDPF